MAVAGQNVVGTLILIPNPKQSKIQKSNWDWFRHYDTVSCDLLCSSLTAWLVDMVPVVVIDLDIIHQDADGHGQGPPQGTPPSPPGPHGCSH